MSSVKPDPSVAEAEAGAQGAASLVEYVRCNLCGADDTTLVQDGIPVEGGESFRYSSSGAEVSQDRIVRCRRCGLEYVNPRLRSEVILEGYSEGSDETFVSQARAREHTFRRSLAFLTRALPAKLRARIGGNDRPRILDVGTAGGSFLKVARDAGWEVSGVEPNRWLCDWARRHYGLHIDNGDLFEQRYAADSFDVVTLWDVLEHVPDPRALLEEVRRILRPDGVLLVNYPDKGSLAAHAMGRRWVFILTVHIYYFTRQTIRRLLEETGFQVTRFRPYVQTLEFGYLVARMEPYSRLLHRAGCLLRDRFGLGGVEVPYWVGQTLVVSAKRRAPRADAREPAA
jgi:2-polyprenyl-3-methyl-5-hydroxy-6-metoxy-1,4-benzoquinol methylase